jgi:hypothetical protein
MDPLTISLIGLGVLGARAVISQPKRSIDDFLQHYWIVSRTRHGKTTYIREKLIPEFRSVAKNGSVVLFETKDEETIRDYLNSLPEDQHAKTLVYAPSDMKKYNSWIGLNLIQKYGRHTSENTILTNELIACFERAFGDAIKSNSRDILRSGTQAVLEVMPQASLLEIYKMFNDRLGTPEDTQKKFTNQPQRTEDPNPYRTSIIERLRSPFLVNYFKTNFIYPSIRTMDLYNPIYNKFRSITNDPMASSCLCQLNGIDIKALIDDGWNIVFFFPKGELGPETSRILSSIAFSKVQLAVQGRSTMNRDNRYQHPVMIIADEFQDYAVNNISFHEFLNQAAGFGVSLVLSHQHIRQEGITESLVHAIRGNVGNIVVGRVGDLDAEIMEEILKPGDPKISFDGKRRYVERPKYSAEKLQNLPRFRFVEKLTISGLSRKPKEVTVGNFKSLGTGFDKKIRRRSLEVFGTHSYIIQRDMRQRLEAASI